MLIKNFLNSKLLIFLIVFLAAFLRVWNIGSNPPSLHADEADTGYTAYSLLQTGSDAYGHKLPLQFKGQAGNYRAPIYTYSVIPSVAVFGLNAFAVRLPSAIFGVSLVIVVFLLILTLFNSKNIAFAGALLTAINPWAIHISRTGLEVSLSVFFVTLGILLFFYGMQKNRGFFLILSSIIFGLTIFSYHPAKIFSPLIILLLLGFYYKQIFKLKKALVISFIVFLSFYILMLKLAFFDKGAAEFNNVSIFNMQVAQTAVNSQRHLTSSPLFISSIFSNKLIYFFREFQNQYVGPISLNYLFINGDSSLDKGMGNYGEYHFFELPLFFLGIYFLIRKNKKIFKLLCLWMALSLIPGAITRTGYYTYRDVNLLPVPIIFSSVGLVEILSYKFFRGFRAKALSVLYMGMISISLIYFVYTYYFAYPVYSRDWWQYDQKQVLLYVLNNQEEYENIFIHGGQDWNVLYAFNSRLDPLIFQKSYRNIKLTDAGEARSIGKVTFGKVIFEEQNVASLDRFPRNSLIIVPGDFFRDSTLPSVKFTNTDGVHVTSKAYKIL